MTTAESNDDPVELTRQSEDEHDSVQESVQTAESPGNHAEENAVSEEEKLRDTLLRITADFDNYRKRVLRDGNRIAAESKEKLFLSLLPVIDHFALGLDSLASKSGDPVIAGFRLVYDQLLNVLQENGLAPVPVKEGDEFDPMIHECIAHLPSAKHPADTIIRQEKTGYRLDGKLLRNPQVVVSSGPEKISGQDPDKDASTKQ